MKPQSTINRVDDLGRVRIPKEFRKQLKIHEGQELEIMMVNDTIIIRKTRSENNV